MNAKWYLVMDAYRFHVYVMVETELERVRIDWHQNSTLEVRPYADKEGELVIKIGEAKYCQECLFPRICRLLYHYQLFSFNCRTVSYLILVDVMHFNEAAVYEHFRSNNTQCGLDSTQCFTWAEIDHFRKWRAAGNSIIENY
jgi:hypothetical protein